MAPTGVLKGRHRRALDSTVLDDAVATPAEGAVRDVLDEVYPWYAAGESVGLATVISTFHSAPRPPWAAMAVSESGTVVGSVSGGCVEGTSTSWPGRRRPPADRCCAPTA
ncbi:XdhC family protein [Kitasatospora azatica]|uniref:XdhC family protein n=1 Tax=Kitasatospora azatica TaxID=58347 RepID=UPI001E55D950|nr:XdhC family protein [Kitasatospora azatica]